MTANATRVGVIGCGTISRRYLECLSAFDTVELVACADLVAERAQKQAATFGVPEACSPEELLAHDDIDVVVNLTIPAAHATVTHDILSSGKSAYGEKPLALNRDDGASLLKAGEQASLRVGSAPDTFLGPGLQTCRRLVDEGAIGEPLAAGAFFMGRGPESWHPNPDFMYKPGGGPLFDVGVYYVTALVNLLGPIRRVSGSTRISRPQRMVTRPDDYGRMIDVTVPTHVSATLDFVGGPIGTLIATFDAQASICPRIEIHGTEASMRAPDPNTFGGPVFVRRAGDDDWRKIPLDRSFPDPGRGIGVGDMIAGLRTGQPHRASGELALHVLDTMQSVHDASDTSTYVELTTRCERPTALTPDYFDNGHV